jgi:uncharacterized protein (DUF1800 family)
MMNGYHFYRHKCHSVVWLALLLMHCWLLGAVVSSAHADQRSILGVDDARHLLARTGIGSSPTTVIELVGKTRAEAIDIIVDGIQSEPFLPMPEWVSQPLPPYHARRDMSGEDRRKFRRDRDAELVQLRDWWVNNLLQTDSPQTERLVLFWHDIFATNYRIVGRLPMAMARQNQTFREFGFGSWQTLLKKMIRDPALMIFLDADSNHKNSPNENLGRELMELFVLGEGNYDEFTVREASRSLTGHNVARTANLQFRLKTTAQDRTHKTLFGKKEQFDGDGLVEQLLKQPAAARFLTTKFWHAFVSDGEPPERWLENISQLFKRSDYSIATLYRAVIESEEFWALENRAGIIKSPVDIIAGTARTLEFPKSQWEGMARWQAQLGMNLFQPPTVAGWTEGEAFITTGRYLDRINLVRSMLKKSFRHQTADQLQTADSALSDQDNEMGPMMQAQAEQGMLSTDNAMSDLDNAMDSTMQAQAEPGMLSTDSAMSDLDNAMDSTTQMQSGHSELSGRKHDLVNVEDATDLESVSEADQPPWRASSANLTWVKWEKEKDLQSMKIALNNLSAPAGNFHIVQFLLTARGSRPISLEIDSFDCWPVCIEKWPASAWTNEHFEKEKHIVLPWAAKQHDLWAATAQSSDQYNKLSDDEKLLISSLWRSVPEILKAVENTKRGRTNEAFLKSFTSRFQEAGVKLSDTPYEPSASIIAIDEQYAPADYPLQPLAAPEIKLASVSELQGILKKRGISLQALLLPAIDEVQDSQFQMHRAGVAENDNQLETRVLALTEQLAFQLK